MQRLGPTKAPAAGPPSRRVAEGLLDGSVPLFPVAAVTRNLAGGVRDVNKAGAIGRLFE